MKAGDRRVVELFKQRVQTLTTVKRVIIFGSRARGQANPESDLDIFIELPEVTAELRQQIYYIAWEVGFEHGIVISTFLVSTAWLANSPLVANPILRAIEKEGVVDREFVQTGVFPRNILQSLASCFPKTAR